MTKYPTLPKYPKLDYYTNLRDIDKAQFLNKNVYWTEKEDGSNVGLFLDVETKRLRVRSRNQNVAMFEPSVLAVPDTEIVQEYLLDNPFLIFYGEYLRTGRSPTGMHTYDKDRLVFFDIYDMRTSRFLPVEDSYDIFSGLGLENCNIEKVTQYATYDDLLADVIAMMDVAKEKYLEGYVYKINDPDIFLKCKPHYEVEKSETLGNNTSQIYHPPMPDTDVYAILRLLRDEIGEETFHQVKCAMPLFAERVAQSCKEDMFSRPRMNLFVYYTNYLSGLW